MSDTSEIVRAFDVATGRQIYPTIIEAGIDAIRPLIEAEIRARGALLPLENITLTVALEQVKRGEAPSEGAAIMCIMALARITGREDFWGVGDAASLPIHRTEAGYPHCSTCDGGGCPDCTDPA